MCIATVRMYVINVHRLVWWHEHNVDKYFVLIQWQVSSMGQLYAD